MAESPDLKTRKGRKIFVFSVASGVGPIVTELMDDEEGHAALSNMMRVETVLAAVIGERISLELSSVVTVNIPGRKSLIDRMPIEAQRAQDRQV